MSASINMDEHNSWGDKIEWFDRNRAKVVGWLTPLPSVGDELRIGREIYRFKDVQVCRDPPDMFFADVEYVGRQPEKRLEIRHFPGPVMGTRFIKEVGFKKSRKKKKRKKRKLRKKRRFSGFGQFV